jgi:hypothetical protein
MKTPKEARMAGMRYQMKRRLSQWSVVTSLVVVTFGLLIPIGASATTTASPSAFWSPSIWEATANGAVYGPTFHGPIANLNKPIVGMASAPGADSYWLVAADGGVFSYDNAAFYGSAATFHLNQPIVGMASTPHGDGYWLVAADGGVFSFGNAAFYGSAATFHLNQPIVGMASTPDGDGYWLVAADGGVFSFGNATFFGSLAGRPLHAPIIGITPTANGAGYWLDGSDGGVFSFGDAGFFGANPGAPGTIVGALMTTPDTQGYWLDFTAEGCQGFGDAQPCVTSTSEPPYTYPPAVGAAADTSGEIKTQSTN